LDPVDFSPFELELDEQDRKISSSEMLYAVPHDKDADHRLRRFFEQVQDISPPRDSL
jgi:hypothetical protein